MAKDFNSLAKKKYSKHKAQSKFRNIDFKFTFQEWYDWWLSNGVNKNQDIKWTANYRPCMCRYNDIGAYELSNVYFANHIENLIDAHKNGKRRGKIYRYRWLNESYSVQDFLQKTNVSKSKLHYYLEEDYEKNNLSESLRLKLQYGKKYQEKITYEYEGIVYKTLTELSIKLKMTRAAVGQRLKKKKFGIKKIITQPTMTLHDYILKNSRFPDPILVF